MTQGSRTSTYGESTGRGTKSLSYLSCQHNLDKECSLLPSSAAVVSESIIMDVDDVFWPIDAFATC